MGHNCVYVSPIVAIGAIVGGAGSGGESKTEYDYLGECGVEGGVEADWSVGRNV